MPDLKNPMFVTMWDDGTEVGKDMYRGCHQYDGSEWMVIDYKMFDDEACSPNVNRTSSDPVICCSNKPGAFGLIDVQLPEELGGPPANGTSGNGTTTETGAIWMTLSATLLAVFALLF
eukprot:scpid44696/ scgid14454/ 